MPSPTTQQERPSGARAQRGGNREQEPGYGLGLDDEFERVNTAGSSSMNPNNTDNSLNNNFDDTFPIKEIEPLEDTPEDTDEFSNLRKLIADVAQPILPPDEEQKIQTASDFVRQFLVARDMENTYNVFQAEWYASRADTAAQIEMEKDPQKKQMLENALRVPPIPQVYIDNQRMAETLRKMRQHLEETKSETEKATKKWHRFKKQRDYHKMHHQRLSQQKNKLVAEFARLQSKYQQYEPTMTDLRQKYEVAMKAKMLIEVDRDKQQRTLESLQRQQAMEAQTRDAVTAANEFNDMSGLDGFSVEEECAESDVNRPVGHISKHSLDKDFRDRKTAKRKNKNIKQNGKNIVEEDDIITDNMNRLDGKVGGHYKNHSLLELVAKVLFGVFVLIGLTVGALECYLRRQNVVRKPLLIDDPAKRFSKFSFDEGISSNGRVRPAEWPPAEGENPHPNKDYPRCEVEKFVCRGTFPGHTSPVSKVVLHPSLPMIATASDDKTWKMWNIPKGELVMSGSGHTDWIGALDIHPQGMYVISGSGDQSIKIWDMAEESCCKTISGVGAQFGPIWDLAFHQSGDFFASASQDTTSRVYDAHTGYSVQKLSGHCDAVNSIHFRPYSNTLVSASADKTVSLWDLRSGLCTQTFYGHVNAANQAKFSTDGNMIASCDSEGVVKVWDCRMVCEMLQIDAGPHSVNGVAWDRSGKCLTLASGDGTVKVFDIGTEKACKGSLEGHSDGILSVALESHGHYMVTGSSDNTFRLWSNAKD
eukprot:gene613-511_t